MMPLALIVKAWGARVEGSDRSLDQGRNADEFDFPARPGIGLHPQDGSGVTRAEPDPGHLRRGRGYRARRCRLRRRSAPRVVTRAAAARANCSTRAPVAIGVGGTSGKSTTTGMIGWILHAARADPTVMNGAVMKNFVTGDSPFASAMVGKGDIFVSEVDESDGSIALFDPRIAVAQQHRARPQDDGRTARPVQRLRRPRRRSRCSTSTTRKPRRLPPNVRPGQALTYSLGDAGADSRLRSSVAAPTGIAFTVTARATGAAIAVALQVPGRHNVSNALAALAAASACGVPLADAAGALAAFVGIRRRLEVVGTANGVTVIDDFAPQPRQDRRHACHAARLSRPPAGDVPAARLWPAAPDEGRVSSNASPRELRGRGHAAHARARLFRRHGRPQRDERRHRRGVDRAAAATPSPSPTAPPAATRLVEMGPPRRPHRRDGRPRRFAVAVRARTLAADRGARRWRLDCRPVNIGRGSGNYKDQSRVNPRSASRHEGSIRNYELTFSVLADRCGCPEIPAAL